ncbi:MAG: M14 family zinc carboxypeptidase [Bacteriovoracaceae bacterium]
MKDLIELKKIRDLIHISNDFVRYEELARVNANNKSYPIIGFTVGSKDKSAPTLGLFGGVHGLEKVGTHVIISFLDSFFKQLKWDRDLQSLMEKTRIVSIPLVNPGGMALNWRANPNGVDLMRNAPVEAQIQSKLPFLLSGHRYSNKIPWYRGPKDSPMEKESQCLVDFVREEVFQAKSAITLDVHSGFGMKDRLWYPYAKTNDDFPRIKEVEALKDLLDETLPHNVYSVEPQSSSYMTHGDLWDYLFDEQHREEKYKENVFIPWTLELGSWMWVKKNPRQLFSSMGLFNPIIDHRYQRTMRRHKQLLNFLLRAIRNPYKWTTALGGSYLP